MATLLPFVRACKGRSADNLAIHVQPLRVFGHGFWLDVKPRRRAQDGLRMSAKGLRIGRIGPTNLRERLGSHIKPCGLNWSDNQYARALGRDPTD